MKKPAIMRKRNTLKISLLLTILLAGVLIVLTSMSMREQSSEKECIEQCGVETKPQDGPAEMIWESLPHQFLSSISISY